MYFISQFSPRRVFSRLVWSLVMSIQYDITNRRHDQQRFFIILMHSETIASPHTFNDQNNCLLDILFNSDFLKSAY
jgi:hypothetical protein